MKSKKPQKNFVSHQEKRGPDAVLREGAYQGSGRRFWVVMNRVGLSINNTPKKAKTEWRRMNAQSWLKKVSA